MAAVRLRLACGGSGGPNRGKGRLPAAARSLERGKNRGGLAARRGELARGQQRGKVGPGVTEVGRVAS